MIPGCGKEAIENSPGQQDFARGISNGITPDLLIGKALVKRRLWEDEYDVW